MKIILLNDDFPPNSYGGAGIVVYNLARELKKMNHEVFIITTTRIKREEGESDLDCLKIFKIYSCYHERWRSWKGLINPQIVSRIEEIIKKIDPDIVHAHNIHCHLSYKSLKIAKKYSKAVFLTVHDVMLFHYGKLMPKGEKYIYRVNFIDKIQEAKKRYNPFKNIIIKYYLRYVDKIFAVSNALKELLKVNGIRNIEVIYNGVNVDEYDVNLVKIEEFRNKYYLANKKILFFGARLSGAKGGEKLLEALIKTKNRISNVLLLVAGQENQHAQKMKRLISDFKIKENVIFLGFLDREKFKLANHSSDVVIFPSLCFETFGLGNLEAMACKKPVISSYFGGPKEVVEDGKTGYLINPNNIELITDRIISLLNDSKKSEQFGLAGYEQAKEKFSLKKKIEETLKWYEKYV